MTDRPSPKKARGPYRKGLRRRREIVAAAAVVFGRYGYRAGSLRAIADLVGTSPATLVAYFTNKEGLLIAVLQHWREESDPITVAFEGLDFIRAFVLLMRYHDAHRGLMELFLTMSIEAAREEHPAHEFMIERQRHTQDTMIRCLKSAHADGHIAPLSDDDLEEEARLLIAGLDGLELQWMLDPRLDLEAVVRRLIDASIARWSDRPLAVVATETDAWLSEHGQAR
jgi:AcrR family transcriptional regulator